MRSSTNIFLASPLTKAQAIPYRMPLKKLKRPILPLPAVKKVDGSWGTSTAEKRTTSAENLYSTFQSNSTSTTIFPSNTAPLRMPEK